MKKHNGTYIAVLQVPAIAAATRWVRTAKTIHISEKADPLLVSAITDAMKVST